MEAVLENNEYFVNSIHSSTSLEEQSIQPYSLLLKKKYSLTLVIPTDVVGLLIGKQGATLREISAESGAKMSFQAFSDMPAGTKERCVVMWGPIEALLRAENLILSKMEIRRPKSEGDEVIIENGKYLLKWLIPNYMCGLLIGRHGDGIKQINEASGAWVKVAHEQESAPGSAERMIYITGTKEQNAIALKLVVQKVAGRPFSEPKEVPLDPSCEVCLYIPTMSVSTVLAGGPDNMKLQNMLDLYDVSLRTSDCNNVETGLTTVRLILKGPEQGRTIVHEYLSDRLNNWRSAELAGNVEKPNGIVLQSYDPENSKHGNSSVELETSLKLTVPSNMIEAVFGDNEIIANEIYMKTNSKVKISPQPSPSIEVDLVVVVLTGLTAHIIKAQEIILLRMLNSKAPLPRLPVQLSNNINAGSGGISSSTLHNNALGQPYQPNQPRDPNELKQLRQLEMQLQYLQQQRNSVLSSGVSTNSAVTNNNNIIMDQNEYRIRESILSQQIRGMTISGNNNNNNVNSRTGQTIRGNIQADNHNTMYGHNIIGGQSAMYQQSPLGFPQKAMYAPNNSTQNRHQQQQQQQQQQFPVMYAMVQVNPDGSLMYPGVAQQAPVQVMQADEDDYDSNGIYGDMRSMYKSNNSVSSRAEQPQDMVYNPNQQQPHVPRPPVSGMKPSKSGMRSPLFIDGRGNQQAVSVSSQRRAYLNSEFDDNVTPSTHEYLHPSVSTTTTNSSSSRYSNLQGGNDDFASEYCQVPRHPHHQPLTVSSPSNSPFTNYGAMNEFSMFGLNSERSGSNNNHLGELTDSNNFPTSNYFSHFSNSIQTPVLAGSDSPFSTSNNNPSTSFPSIHLEGTARREYGGVDMGKAHAVSKNISKNLRGF